MCLGRSQWEQLAASAGGFKALYVLLMFIMSSFVSEYCFFTFNGDFKLLLHYRVPKYLI